MKNMMIGVDLAKNVFQLHGALPHAGMVEFLEGGQKLAGGGEADEFPDQDAIDLSTS